MKCHRLLVPCLLLLFGAALLVSSASTGAVAKVNDELEALEFMKELDVRFNHECNLEMTARWGYITDVTDAEKEEAANAAAVRYLGFKGEAAVNSSQFDYSGFSDIDLYRRFRFLSKKGPGALTQEDLTEYKLLQAGMETIYSTATICDFADITNCDLTLEPDIEMVMATSEDWDELAHAWIEWRQVTGKLMRDDFIRFVELSNKAASLDGFDNTGSYWLNGYTVDAREAQSYADAEELNQQQFRDMVEAVLQQVSEDLYKKLHAYVRMKLSDVYPGQIDLQGPIPAHILGDMWAQDWSNIARHVMPFPELPTFDVTESMVENGWNIERMFESAEDFFMSLELFPMTDTFWTKSVINQTAWGKTIVCHASAEDFCLGPESEDFRIKMCTDVNMVDLVTVHHEMGHIEYFMAYRNLPHVFRDSANPGIHEAIGDLIALSVSTPKHLEEVLGLTPTRRMHPIEAAEKDAEEGARYTEDEKRDLNFLMKMALEKIAFLPFGYLIDKYRWGVFDGSIPTSELNAGWWQLREDLQGVTAPDGFRGEEYFDPGAKYHVPANVPYIRYFVSFIVQFQFQQQLCKAAGHVGPLHTCDIYSNTEAGQILRTALEKGFSEPWPVVLHDLGGSADMDPKAIIDYFQPLIDYLDDELLQAGQCVGWGDDCASGLKYDDKIDDSARDAPTDGPSTDEPTGEPSTDEPTGEPSTDEPTNEPTTTTEVPTTTISPTDEKAAKEKMKKMDEEMTLLVQTATLVDWDYYTNVTDENAAASNNAWLQVSTRYNELHQEVIQQFEYWNFTDTALKRQFELQKNLGTAALTEERAQKLNGLVLDMTSQYTAVVCPHDKQGCDAAEALNSDQLEEEMKNPSNDYEALQYYWDQWRAAAGAPIKDNYTEYIELQNEAAQLNNFEDAGLMWLDPYTSDDYDANKFKQEIEGLWNQTRPLYKRLHAYVRHKLKDTYSQIDKEADLIPAHVLGNMWGQSWENIYEIVKPYPNATIPNLTPILEAQSTVREMFDLAEEFFTSIGLFNMTKDFHNKTMYEDPGDRDVICHASAWDFYDTIKPQTEGRFRIKMCTNKNQEDFTVIHHEMGHTQYQMAYSEPVEERPMIFRDGANPGFHEAIGDTIALSVSTPAHLKIIADRLTPPDTTTSVPTTDELTTMPETTMPDSTTGPAFAIDELDTVTATDTPDITTIAPASEEDINFLMKTALAKVSFLPFAYILDQWRWEAFAKTFTDQDFNRQWWDKRIAVQGLRPPTGWSPEGFDIGCKYHVPTSVPYIRYFVSYILQFQFHAKLCKISGYKGPIYNCDIYNNEAAGAHLKSMLAKGASEPWQKQLKEFLEGDGVMDASAILEYFQPLDVFLKGYIDEHKLTVGWDEDQVDVWVKETEAEIPATVPIVVGIVLAVMVVIVIIAFFVGRAKQKKKEKARGAPPPLPPGETIELEPKTEL